MLRSHRIKAHATADTMHKPLGFEVLHFVLYVRVWLHQGVPVDQSLQQSYGRCCRMTGGESQNPDGTTPIPEDIADSTGDTGQRRTQSQSRNPRPSGSVHSITATIDHMSLVTAMSRMNENSSGNLDKGVQPKWNFKVEPWTDFQHKVEIWAAFHDIAHLLERDPYPSEQRKHDTAMRTVLLNLPSHDRAYVRGQTMLHEVWSMLTSKYMPSIAAEATKLWIQFEGLRQRGRTMQEHVNECMTVCNRLLAINEPVPDRQFTHKLLNVDKELYHVQATLAHANIDAIISGLTDAYAFMHMNDPPQHHHQHQQGHGGRGRFQRRFPRGSGAPQGAGVAAMAAANGQGEERVCYNCNEAGYVKADCPKLHPAVREATAWTWRAWPQRPWPRAWRASDRSSQYS